jgi:putative heavy-metal chelation protein
MRPGLDRKSDAGDAMNSIPSTLEKTRPLLRKLASDHGLLDVDVYARVGCLTPADAIGTPIRRDFPLVVGKERVIEARVLGARGHAFTDAPREFTGTLDEVLALDLSISPDRAVFVAVLNAVLRHLGEVMGTVHCRDEEPERCAREIAAHVLEHHGRVDVGLIGLNPAIAERLVQTFGPEHVRIADLDPDHVGTSRFGVRIQNGETALEKLIDASDVVLFTGTTLVNSTFDRIWDRITAARKPYLTYGVTGAGVAALLGLNRICPCAREG